MSYSSLDKGFSAGNPLASALVIVVGSLVIAASIVIGFFAFVILGSLLMIVAAAVSIRLWWLRRKMARDPAFPPPRGDGEGGSNETIEGVYHVVIEERRDSQD